MPLQFIMGNSGSGKSHFLYQRMIEESMKNPERNYIAIVPEQFTMQTQKELVLLHPDKGIMNIDVLSFRRLAHRIFEELGQDGRSVLTETGKNLMLRKVAMEQKGKLQVLGSKMNRPGYVSEVKSVLSELMQYEITDFELQEMLKFAENRPLLRAKLADIRTLYSAFLEYQRDRFMKPEELLDVLARMAPDSELLKNSILAFDGFTGFTPSQMKVMEELLAICPQIWITVTIDARADFYGEIREHELFALSKKMIRNVSRAAVRAGHGRAEILEEPVILGKEKLPRFRTGGALYHLEQNLFRTKRAQYRKISGISAAGGSCDDTGQMVEMEAECAGSGQMVEMEVECAGFRKVAETGLECAGSGQMVEMEAECAGSGKVAETGAECGASRMSGRKDGDLELSLHVSANPAQEVHFAARTICRLVREEGYRYQDIAVITGNMSSYDNYVKKIFPNYEVPAFLDETRHILLNPCLEFVRGALLAAEKDFSSETVFRFLRTQMAGLSPEETDRLENYVLAAGIRGHGMWSRPWTYQSRGMTPEELEACNGYRKKAMEHFLPFSEKMRQKNQTVVFYAQALCTLLEDCQIQQQLKDREILLLQSGQREEAREYAQIYGILITLLDEMVDLMGEETISGQEFLEILDAGFSEAQVGIIPPGIDQVQVGDIERSRLAHVKVLFFLGLNDGWVPARGDGGGIVSDMERELLQKTGIELAPSARENSYIQRFYLYQNLTKPEDRLYLSWCKSSSDGTAMRPSYLISTVERLFPQIETVQEQEAGAEIRQITSKKNGFLYLTKGLSAVRDGAYNPAWMELYRMYLQEDSYSVRVRELVRAAFSGGMQGQLSYQVSKELYGEVMANSVTRLEQFAACAFAHFAAYGLRLSGRELYGVKPADLGIIFHRAMELFSRRLQNTGQEWTQIPIQEQQRLMDQCVDEISQEYRAGVLHTDAREEYRINRIKRILGRTVWALHQQLLAGSFRPEGFEVSFSDAGDLEAVHVKFGKNGNLHLQGRIDRIDTAKTDDTIYVKVVDYKSGMTKFDPVSLYYGLQLQLVVYLNAALEMERRLHPDKKVIPAGIFYYHLDDPILEKEVDSSREATQDKLLKKLRPDGVLNGDETVLRLLDQSMQGDSLVIPAGLKKDGSLKATSSAVSEEQLKQLSGFVSHTIQKMAGEILDGVIAAEPFEDRSGSACDYCDYADVCGFDKRIPEKCRKRRATLTKDEAWERISQEEDEWGI